MEKIHVQATYNPDTDLVTWRFAGAVVEVSPIAFAQAVEYLELIKTGIAEYKRLKQQS